ncbi:MAG: hypothetical protein JSW54_11370 [Fidelibacterota bacterium]|nr:MAG: hypothetical protein JSW54_11370 [Candidatus Neomarinimicrobiota bacterium]
MTQHAKLKIGYTIALIILLGLGACVLRQPQEETPVGAEDEWQPPLLVTLEGVAEANNLSSKGNFMVYYPYKVADYPVALPVRNGDLLYISDEEDENENFYLYDVGDGLRPSLELDSSLVQVNSRAVSLLLSEGTGAWKWLAEAEPQDLDLLRLLVIDDTEKPDPSHKEILQRLSAIRPSLKVVFSWDESLAVFPLSSDFWIFFDSLGAMDSTASAEDVYALLADMNPEWLTVAESDSLTFLNEFSGLRTLEIMEWTNSMGSLPAELDELRSLIIGTESDSIDLSNLEGLTSLQEFRLVAYDDLMLTNISTLSKLPNLRSVTFFSLLDSLAIADLQELEGLRWLGLPANIHQEQFAAIVDNHPDLLGLELFMEEPSIHDLTPLTELRKLEYLIIICEEDYDYSPLRELSTLRYLGLIEDVFEDTLGTVAMIEASLPETVIAAWGVCLGSGWILVLLPMVAMIVFLLRWRNRPTMGQ